MSVIAALILIDGLKKNKGTKTIYAIFKGRDGSLGYETGKAYHLRVKYLTMFERVFKPWDIEIEDIRRQGGFCPYTNFFTFLENWRPL